MLALTNLGGFGGNAGLPPGTAAWTMDGSLNGNSSTFVYTIVGTGISVGSLAIVGGSMDAGTISSVADSKGNTWSVDKTINAGGVGVGIASAVLTADLLTGDTITITTSAAMRSAWCGYYGLPSASPLDKTASATGTSTTPTATTPATTQAKELVVGVAGRQTSGTFTQDGAFTTIVLNADGTHNTTAGQKVTGSTGAQTYAPTLGVSVAWALCVATYKVT